MNPNEVRRAPIKTKVLGLLGTAMLFLSGCGFKDYASYDLVNCFGQPKTADILLSDIKDKDGVLINGAYIKRNNRYLTILNPDKVVAMSSVDNSIVFDTNGAVFTATLVSSANQTDNVVLRVQAACH